MRELVVGCQLEHTEAVTAGSSGWATQNTCHTFCVLMSIQWVIFILSPSMGRWKDHFSIVYSFFIVLFVYWSFWRGANIWHGDRHQGTIWHIIIIEALAGWWAEMRGHGKSLKYTEGWIVYFIHGKVQNPTTFLNDWPFVFHWMPLSWPPGLFIFTLWRCICGEKELAIFHSSILGILLTLTSAGILIWFFKRFWHERVPHSLREGRDSAC